MQTEKRVVNDDSCFIWHLYINVIVIFLIFFLSPGPPNRNPENLSSLWNTLW